MRSFGIFHCGDTPHLKHAAYTVASIRRAHPVTTIYQVSSVGTPRIAGVDHLIELPELDEHVQSGRLMLANVIAQRFLVDAVSHPEICFVDTDVLLLRPLAGEAFRDDYDLAVTWRHETNDFMRRMPYNYGVMHLRRTDGTMHFLDVLINTISRMTLGLQRWYGNQVGLRQMIGALPPRLAAGKEDSMILRLTIDDEPPPVLIKLVPCATHNYTPDTPWEALDGRYIVHCKGPRKPWIEDIYSRIERGSYWRDEAPQHAEGAK